MSNASSAADATGADISAATRAVPEDLGRLLERHGVDQTADSGLRATRSARHRLAAVALAWLGPVSACALAVLLGPLTAAVWTAAIVAGASSLIAIRLLQRHDPGEPMRELAGALLLCLASASLPGLLLLLNPDIVVGFAVAGLVVVVAMIALLPWQGRFASLVVRAGLAGIPALTTVLFGTRHIH